MGKIAQELKIKESSGKIDIKILTLSFEIIKNFLIDQYSSTDENDLPYSQRGLYY